MLSGGSHGHLSYINGQHSSQSPPLTSATVVIQNYAAISGNFKPKSHLFPLSQVAALELRSHKYLK